MFCIQRKEIRSGLHEKQPLFCVTIPTTYLTYYYRNYGVLFLPKYQCTLALKHPDLRRCLIAYSIENKKEQSLSFQRRRRK